VLTLYYSGGQYVIPIHLEARRSYNLDMMSLVRSRVPDANDDLIPSNINSGSAMLSGPRGDFDKISVAIAASVFNVRNATCGLICNTCNGVTGVDFDSSSYGTPMNGTAQAAAEITMNTGSTSSASGVWSTGSSSIAAVDSSGLITGVYPGMTNVQLVVIDVPVDAGTICSAELVPCPTESYAATPAQVSVFPQVSGITTFTYGQSGGFVITGTGFEALGAPVTVYFSDPNISGGSTPGTVNATGTSITGTYSMGCGANLSYLPSFWIQGSYGEGTMQTLSQPLPWALPTVSAPTINLNGTQVSGTQSVVVGQQIALTASQSLPNCMALNSQSWTQPTGTTVGNYVASTASGSVTDTALPANSNSFTYYWIAPGNPLNVSYSTGLITTSGDGYTESSPTATAQFNVAGPTNLNVYTCGGAAVCTSNGALAAVGIGVGPKIDFGVGTLNGIIFTASANPSPPGTFSFVQLLNSADTTYDQLNGTQCLFNQGSGLDGAYPYATASTPPTTNGPTATDDSPGRSLFPDDSEVTVQFNATMYVMWTPSTVSAPIPVPMGSVTWSFTGDAVQNLSTGVWSINTKTVSKGSASAFVSSTTYPTWATDIPSPGTNPCS
jgi:hypothetical protein